MRLPDVADTEQLFRLIQSIPSPKAEPFKQWMAQVAAYRIARRGGATAREAVEKEIGQSVVLPMNAKQIAQGDALAITGTTQDEIRSTASKQPSARKAA